jgi:predicted nucleic acid-binding protein
MSVIWFLLAALPVYLLLAWVQRGSLRRSVHVTDEAVEDGLIAERKRAETALAEETARERLAAVRECEKRVYGRIGGKRGRGSAEPAVPEPEKAAAAVAALDARIEAIDARTVERAEELERTMEARKAELIAVNRRLRVTDKVFAAVAWAGLTWLSVVVVLVLYALLV